MAVIRSGLLICLSLLTSICLAQAKPVELRSPEECYAAKDRACLESLQPKLSFDKNDKTPLNYDPSYYLALHILDTGGDAHEAKKYLMTAVLFGKGHQLSKNKLTELYRNGIVEFDPVDCMAIEDTNCLKNLADNKNNAPAQYLYGQSLIKSNPALASAYLKKAASQDHKTAICILAKGTQEETLETDYSYHDAVELLRNDCITMSLYKRMSKDYFKKYSKKTGHKAFAYSDSGWSYYQSGFLSQDVAARAALEHCKTVNKKKEQPCRVINIDDQWVKETIPAEFAQGKAGVDTILTQKALDSFKQKYEKSTATKVFVQSNAGAWSWRSSSDKSLESITNTALTNCRSQNRKLEAKFPCRVINENGEWK